MSNRLFTTSALAALFAAACGSPAPGTEGADCPNDNNCRPGLFCDDGQCALRPRDGGVGDPRDAGVRDGGRDAGPYDGGPYDAGPRDAGLRDAGCPLPPTLTAIQSQIFGGANQPNCNQSTCHGAAQAGNLRLDSPLATLHADLLGPTRAGGANEPNIVVPGEPQNSRLMRIISVRNPGGGGGPMPPTGILDACDIETIKVWIEDGAQP